MLKAIFEEPYREKRRISLGRSKFLDIFYYSGVYDYRILRMFINFPIGFVIAFLLYNFAWHRINFAYFDRVAEQILRWALILACSITFAISPLFRCAIVCVLFGALGKNGQGLLSIIVFNNLSGGPVENIVDNFKLTTNMVTCHIKQKEDMITQRIVMATGPIESFMARQFGDSSSKGQKMIAMLKSLVEPIMYDFTLSDEDKAMAATIDTAEVLHRRNYMVNRMTDVESDNDIENAVVQKAIPAWQKMRSKNKCYNILWFLPLVKGMVCDNFDTLQICQASKKVLEAVSFCDNMMQETLSRTKNFDNDMVDAYNLSENIMDHLRVNMHYRAIVEPRNVRIYGIKEVKYRIEQNFRLLKIILVTLKQILGCLFVFMIYTIFRDAVTMIRNYLDNIDFNNVFLTSYFWHIDQKRQNEKKIHLYPLSKAEKRANGLMVPFSPPTKEEIRASWLPLAKFIFILVVAGFVVFIDSIFYLILDSIARHTTKEVVSEQEDYFSFKINGTGFVADLIKDMLEFDYKKHRNSTIATEKCIFRPTSPDWNYAGQYIFFPLLIMFLLQVIFGYVIKRFTLFCVISNIFRKRYKARIIHLYNKMLFVRINGRRLARARLRFQVQRRILELERIRQENELFAGTVVRKISDYIFKTGTCLMCEMKSYKRRLLPCPDCPATYCPVCFEENNKLCYACLVKEGKVTSQRTQFLPQQDEAAETVVDTGEESASE